MLETWFIQVSNFQKSACSITYISKKILPTVDEHMLDYVVRLFQMHKMSREFCRPSLRWK